MNQELDHLIDGAEWCKHSTIHKSPENSMARNGRSERIVDWTPLIQKARERPKKRWKDDVLEDVEMLGVRNWKRAAVDRSE